MSTSTPSPFPDRDEQRARIAAAVASRFACYGQGTPDNHRNATAVSLAKQPPCFGFGVRVRDVVDAVLDMAESEGS